MKKKEIKDWVQSNLLPMYKHVNSSLKNPSSKGTSVSENLI